MPCFGWYCVGRAQGGLLKPALSGGRSERGSPTNQVQSAAVISSLGRGWLSPPPSHSCSHPLQPPLPLSFPFIIPSHSHSTLSIYPFELDRSGTLSPCLSDTVGRCHLRHRPVKASRGRRNDRGHLALPCARRTTVSRRCSPFAPTSSPGSPFPTDANSAVLGLDLPVAPVCDGTNTIYSWF